MGLTQHKQRPTEQLIGTKVIPIWQQPMHSTVTIAQKQICECRRCRSGRWSNLLYASKPTSASFMTCHLGINEFLLEAVTHACFKYSDYCTPMGTKNWIINSSHDYFWRTHTPAGMISLTGALTLLPVVFCFSDGGSPSGISTALIARS